MTEAYCERWIRRSACLLAECLVAGECRFSAFDQESNDAFLEAMEKSRHRPRLLDDDGRIQLCEQCNNDDGKAIEIGIGSISVSSVWAHDAFGSGVCRLVYMCQACWQALLLEVFQGIESWFGPWHEMYGIHEDCAACRAELGA